MSERIVTGRSFEDRKLLPVILEKQWKIDTNSIKTKFNKPLLESIKNVITIRNKFIHEGKEVLETSSLEGLEAIDLLIEHILMPIANKLKFNVSGDGKWHRLENRFGT